MSRPSPDISVIVPVRNRSGMRLENCLKSLRWQRRDGDLLGDALEIVISDFGSESPHRESVDALAERYDVRVVRTETDQVWNRSLVLNIGIRAAAGRYVMGTDADMVFQDDFLGAALAVFERAPEAFICCRCHDLPEAIAERAWEASDIPDIIAKGTVRNFGGTGACQIAGRDFFEAVHGYDEGYVYWGSEDKDMFYRAERYGLIVQWLDEMTAMGHQWHPTLRNDRWLQTRINRWRYKLTKNRVVKNRKGWGLRP